MKHIGSCLTELTRQITINIQVRLEKLLRLYSTLFFVVEQRLNHFMVSASFDGSTGVIPRSSS